MLSLSMHQCIVIFAKLKLGLAAQVEKWLKRAFLPGMSTFRPSAVAVVITSPGAAFQYARSM